jgi:hypothetical protein
MMELLTGFVELAAFASETRAAPCSARVLYKRCRETLNGSLSRVKDGAGGRAGGARRASEQGEGFNAANAEAGALRTQQKAGRDPSLRSRRRWDTTR